MKIKEKAITAILAVFPTTESLSKFTEKSDNAIIYDSLIDYAVRNDLIKTADENNYLKTNNPEQTSFFMFLADTCKTAF